jgi:7,8-dihydropterin-6-yl-methyl-4-(beta-D-ribofuranosyl)aminobenzene 5'-phosphate synthase
VLTSISKRPVKVICHPDAFLRRWIVYPNGNKAALPFLDEESLANQGAIFKKITKPSFLPEYVNDDNKFNNNNNTSGASSASLLITAQIPRETGFEKGFPIQYKEDPTNKEDLIPDPLINDDQAIIANIKQKGLVIITGCGHAGIVNTIRYAVSLTKVNKIHAVSEYLDRRFGRWNNDILHDT